MGGLWGLLQRARRICHPLSLKVGSSSSFFFHLKFSDRKMFCSVSTVELMLILDLVGGVHLLTLTWHDGNGERCMMVHQAGGSTQWKNTPYPPSVFLKVLLDLKVALVLYVKSLASNALQWKQSNLHQRQQAPCGSNKLLIFSKVQKKLLFIYFFNAVLNFQSHLRHIELQRPKAGNTRCLLACWSLPLHICGVLTRAGVW